MWIASELGFFSIVRKEGAFHVRARVREDLVGLKAAAGLKARIEEWPSADYRWRMRVGPRALAEVFGALPGTIDYPNFKSRIAGLPAQREKLPAYEGLWMDLRRVQEAAGREMEEAWPGYR